MARPVALVVVSHSDLVARGVVEVAAQMAPDVHLAAAGGTAEGGIGTSFDAVQEAVDAALATEGVTAVVLTADLGSAVMTAESVVDFSDGDVRLAEGAVVEGTVAAAVQAQLGADAATVAQASAGALGTDAGAAQDDAGAASEPPAPSASPMETGDASAADDALRREVEIVNEQGLHARPAALLARTAAGFDAKVLIDGADASSILALMGLGTAKGDTVTLTATGPQASEALDAVATAIGDGLGDQ